MKPESSCVFSLAFLHPRIVRLLRRSWYQVVMTNLSEPSVPHLSILPLLLSGKVIQVTVFGHENDKIPQTQKGEKNYNFMEQLDKKLNE